MNSLTKFAELGCKVTLVGIGVYQKLVGVKIDVTTIFTTEVKVLVTVVVNEVVGVAKASVVVGAVVVLVVGATVVVVVVGAVLVVVGLVVVLSVLLFAVELPAHGELV
jgi:hypothetical protein